MSSASAASVQAVLRQARERLVQCGVDANEAQQHAEWMVLHVLGWSRTRLLMDWHEPMDQQAERLFSACVERRAKGEPVQYILGEQLFYGRMFYVAPGVLIPRPETEILVEHALRVSELCKLNDQVLVADIGSGSGAIGLSLLAERPEWNGIQVDLSEQALDITQENVHRLGLQSRVELVQGSFLEPLIAQHRCPDLLVSNPPYIPSADMPTLQREVRDFEPHLALHGGVDGLDPYREIVRQIEWLGRVPRAVLFEVGIGQAEMVSDLLKQADHWQKHEIIADWQGIGRVVIAY